jgi:hypothetical protein
MTSGADLLVQITNNSKGTITVNGRDAIESSSSRTYKLRLPLLMIRYESGIDVMLSGEDHSDTAQPSGMCLCMLPNTRVGIQVEQSMNITIGNGTMPSADTALGPFAVGCGDG